MTEGKRFKGTWLQRAVVLLLSLILGVLFFWLLGFVTTDIGALPGPDFARVEARYVDPDLVKKQQSDKEILDSIRDSVKNKQEQQEILKKSTDSLQNTINQLLSIQKQSIERNLEFPPKSQQTLAESQVLFVDNQKQYQVLNNEIAELLRQQHKLEKDLADIVKQMDAQRSVAYKEFAGLASVHRLKVAALKLAVMVPVFLIATWFFMRRRGGAYEAIVYAAFIAAFIRIGMIVHEYFPRRYFKYVALVVIVGIVLRLLAYLLKRIVSPKQNVVLKQHQEAYDKGVCPVCAKPISTRLLQNVFRRARKVSIILGQEMEAFRPQEYTCPSCGAALYEKCDKCGGIRHVLLPFCEHCGNEKAAWSGVSTLHNLA